MVHATFFAQTLLMYLIQSKDDINSQSDRCGQILVIHDPVLHTDLHSSASIFFHHIPISMVWCVFRWIVFFMLILIRISGFLSISTVL